MAGFNKKTEYYRGTVYEFNLPTGWSCPSAKECLVKVDKVTGEFDNSSNAYRCYAASAERFPAVRRHRWINFQIAQKMMLPPLPKGAKAIRIHMAGDFFSQAYFDLWINYCYQHPSVEFWAYTKSLNYWVKRLKVIPHNLTLTASYGGKHDHLIIEHDLKYVWVFDTPAEAKENGLLIDTNDDLARSKKIRKFALIDNYF